MNPNNNHFNTQNYSNYPFNYQNLNNYQNLYQFSNQRPNRVLSLLYCILSYLCVACLVCCIAFYVKKIKINYFTKFCFSKKTKK